MFGRTDYEVIGSIGFAQVGTLDYHERSDIEDQVLREWASKQVIPDEFEGLCWLTMKYFPHDFGSYGELVIKYSNCIREWEYGTDEEEEKYDRFWDFVNSLCDFDFESLYDECDARYVGSMTVVHKQEEFKGLKVVNN
jgi:hypothetical protein